MAPRVTSFDVTVDTCVLYPAARRDTLLRFAEAGFYRPHWSDQITDELARNLIKRRGLTSDQTQKLVAVMNEAFPEARVTGYQPLIDAMPNHPGDRHVLAAEVKSRSQVIVTSNLKHFRARRYRSPTSSHNRPTHFCCIRATSTHEPRRGSSSLRHMTRSARRNLWPKSWTRSPSRRRSSPTPCGCFWACRFG